MSKARELAELGAAYDSGALSNRNVIINGAMQVAQRGTSFASVGNVYTLDRFEFYKQNSGAAFTVTQSSVTDLEGFPNALKVDCTTADTSLASNEQSYVSCKLEGQDLQKFQKGYSTALGFTLSFYVKTNKTGLYTVSMFDRDNTRKVNGSYTVADTGWNRYTISFPADTTGKFDDDNASSLEIFFNLYAGSDTNTGTLSETWAASADAGSTTGQVNFADSTSNDWEITGVQLETGSEATPFEHRSFGDELIRCQRYFFQETGTASNASGILGVASGAATVVFNQALPVQMRTKPSVALTSTNLRIGDTVAAGFTTTSGTIAVQTYSGSASATYTLGGFSGLTSYRTYLHEPDSTSTGFVKFDAEI